MDFYKTNLQELKRMDDSFDKNISNIHSKTISEMETNYNHRETCEKVYVKLKLFSKPLFNLLNSETITIENIELCLNEVLEQKLSIILRGKTIVENDIEFKHYIKVFAVKYVVNNLVPSVQLFNDLTLKKSYLNTFPVKVNYMLNFIDHILFCIDSISDKLQKDSFLIRKSFNIDDFKLRSLNISVGDLHVFRKCVCICELLINQKIVKIVYKDRSSKIDDIFEKIVLSSLSKTKDNIKIELPKRISLIGYSWYEFIEYRECKSLDEAKKMYANIGQTIGLLFCTNSSDIHRENLITNNSVPYIIDTECLFSTRIDFDNILSGTVLDTHVVPRLVGNPNELELCGLELYKNTNSEDYREIFKNIIVQNYLVIVKKIINNAKEIESCINKYEYNVRVLYRSTEFYAKILKILEHPRYQNNWLDRKLLISKLLINDDIPMDIISQEIKHLNDGIIPIFHQKHIKDDMIYQNIKNKLQLLKQENERVYHEDILKASLDYFFETKSSKDLVFTKDNPQSVINYILLVKRTTFSLRKKNFQLNLNDTRENGKTLNIMGNSLYNGLGGHLFLLICIYKTSKLESLKKEIEIYYFFLYQEFMNKNLINIGVYDGDAGILYLTYLMIECMENKFVYIEYSENIMQKYVYKYALEEETKIDVLSGLAGFLIVLIRLGKFCTNSKFENLKKNVVNKIIKSSEIGEDKTVTWGNGYTGFSHGNSGIIYALALFNENSPSDTIEATILKGLEYEKKCRNSTGWIDYRNKNIEEDFNSWCHGSLGIKLSRESMLQESLNLSNDIIRILKADIDYEKHTRTNRYYHTGHSICHGNVGYILFNKNEKAITELIDKGLHLNNDKLFYNKSLFQGELGVYYSYLRIMNENVPDIMLLK
ncbi:DUF4135 domain-containing protein [Carnobacterium maltaromaticum]|uniref:DUF4135 domain-containing protein n=1 Tax=Carnobacterium maltaromaticum TaxID=2751 RepID=UPI00191B90D0|nr:DUF4135 domain-containing protein [Carnobacterium maltaromaticum]CAD5903049.1 hypothetical protein CMALT394_610003 [Carnobacterium maltaromaticum]